MSIFNRFLSHTSSVFLLVILIWSISGQGPGIALAEDRNLADQDQYYRFALELCQKQRVGSGISSELIKRTFLDTVLMNVSDTDSKTNGSEEESIKQTFIDLFLINPYTVELFASDGFHRALNQCFWDAPKLRHQFYLEIIGSDILGRLLGIGASIKAYTFIRSSIVKLFPVLGPPLLKAVDRSLLAIGITAGGYSLYRELTPSIASEEDLQIAVASSDPTKQLDRKKIIEVIKEALEKNQENQHLRPLIP